MSFKGRSSFLSGASKPTWDGQDLRDEWINRNKGDKEVIPDDIVFEVELARKIESTTDYILMLVKKCHDSHFGDKEVLVTIQKVVDASPELHSKKDNRAFYRPGE